MKGFLVSGIPELLLLSLGFIWGNGEQLCAILAAALIHELGHITAAVLLGVRLRFCRTGISGILLLYDFSIVSHAKEAAVCIAGPAAGLAVFFICYATGQVSFFAGASAALSFFNLLPISFLDGGCTVRAVLSSFLSPNTVWRICRIMSFVFTLALWCAAVFVMLRAEGNLSVMTAAIYLLYRLFSEA